MKMRKEFTKLKIKFRKNAKVFRKMLTTEKFCDKVFEHVLLKECMSQTHIVKNSKIDGGVKNGFKRTKRKMYHSRMYRMQKKKLYNNKK